MKIVAVLFIVAIMALMVGCGNKEKMMDSGDDAPDAVSESAPEATDAEAMEDFDETYVEDEDIDIGELY